MVSISVSDPLAEELAGSQGIRGRWSELAQASDNIFSTWEWAQIWWRHFHSGQRFELVRVNDQQGVAKALLPLLHERRAGLHISRFIGHGVADELGPVCAAADRDAASEALDALAEQADVFLAERLRADHRWLAASGRMLKRESSPVIDLTEAGSWEDYLQTHSSNFRQQVRRRVRRLSRELQIEYRLAQDPDRLNADLDILFALHRARWGEDSGAFAGRREAFHREFAAKALRRGWLRLWIAESDGRAVAVWYGFRFAGVESFYQAGRDPRFDQFKVGSAILEHSIREAFQDGQREYRLLRGDEAYKLRYATSVQTVKTLVVAHSPIGRGVVSTADVLARHPRGRRLLTRFAGR